MDNVLRQIMRKPKWSEHVATAVVNPAVFEYNQGNLSEIGAPRHNSVPPKMKRKNKRI